MIVALWFCLGAQAAPRQDIQSFYQGQLFDYVRQNDFFFASKCKVAEDTAMIFIPESKFLGIYGEFSRDGAEENGADVRFSDSRAQLGDLMIGGLATRLIQQKIIEALVRIPFVLMPSSRVKTFLSEPPKTKCNLESP